jgi:hypothetical protein
MAGCPATCDRWSGEVSGGTRKWNRWQAPRASAERCSKGIMTRVLFLNTAKSAEELLSLTKLAASE